MKEKMPSRGSWGSWNYSKRARNSLGNREAQVNGGWVGSAVLSIRKIRAPENATRISLASGLRLGRLAQKAPFLLNKIPGEMFHRDPHLRAVE